MRVNNRSQDLMEATMQLVAESGLSSFSTRQAARRVGVSDGLMYRFFPSKDDLLYACFESVHRQVAALFDGAVMPEITAPADVVAAVRGMWMQYFAFLVKNDYRTVFYFEYRDSPNIRKILEHDDQVQGTYFSSFVQIIGGLDSMLHFRARISPHYLWTYVLDLSGAFAKRVIRGELPNTPESYETIWQLLSGGLMGLLQGTV